MQQSCHPPCEGRPRGPALLAILDPIDPIDLKNYKILISRWEAWYYFKIRPVESEVQSSFSCTLNPHFFRRVFCMLRYTQLYSNPCISCIFWLHHACRSTAAHAPGSGRAAADEHQAWRTAGICAAFTHNSPHSRTSSGGSPPNFPLSPANYAAKLDIHFSVLHAWSHTVVSLCTADSTALNAPLSTLEI